MKQPRSAAVVITAEENGTFTVLDACGRIHKASSSAELGRTCAQVVGNPDLPPLETGPKSVEETLAGAVPPTVALAAGAVKAVVDRFRQSRHDKQVAEAQARPQLNRAELRRQMESREAAKPRIRSVRT